MSHITRTIKMTTLMGMVIFIIGCSPKKYILNQFDGVFDSIEYVYLTDDDPQLVKESFPFNLKIIEILLDQGPDDREMLLTALSSFTMYSYGFVIEDAEKLSLKDYAAGNELYNRANKLFNRAFHYGLHGMELKYPEFNNWLAKRDIEHNPFEKEDISYLYWLSAAIGGSISSSHGNPVFVVDLPKVGWLLEKSMEIEESWNSGALYSAMISFTMSRPDVVANREQVALDYFNKAVQASSGEDCSVYVRYAESVCIKNQNKDEFIEKLNFVLNFDIERAKELRLTNTMAQSRAKWLMERIDELFY
ncbi:TRAP transporter TatT component family protein [bacterium]|nr:TRAP transporter TatT component family protein [bacterium]